MNCEICGRETPKAKKIVMDGLHIVACPDCAGYGKEERQVFAPKATVHRTNSILQIDDELRNGYGQAVRQARQKKGLTIEELGRIVFEKASLLHHIESESAKPSQKLVKKLEITLGIKLTETTE